MRLIFVTLVSSAISSAASVSPIDLQWRDYETTCNATFIIKGFHEFIQEGAKFQTKAKILQADLHKFTTDTCPKNLEEINGARSFEAIVPELKRLSERSVILRGIAKKEADYISGVFHSTSENLRNLHLEFTKMNCATAMRSSLSVLQSEANLILKKYQEMKACPALAKLETIEMGTAGAKRTLGTSKGRPLPHGKSKNGASDITGTENIPSR
jgi:hypothetical protein